MSSSTIDRTSTLATSVEVSDDTLSVQLSDGRTIAVPLAWYPRLVLGSQAERNATRLIANGTGIHWPQLDEDISVENLLNGQRSMESQQSLKKWLETRSKN